MFGKCIPVVRGNSVFQPAVDLCIKKLQMGEWVHVFPGKIDFLLSRKKIEFIILQPFLEGKVNMEKERLRYKWGVGRILLETHLKCPGVKVTILPIWHEGMDSLLPNTPPYRFRFNTKLTFNFGKPICLNETLKHISDNNTDEVEARRLITEEIQKKLEVLRVETEFLHKKS
jgi:monolysocardiolipin acyltransferase